jgi:Predicted metal-dependent hydrolase
VQAAQLADAELTLRFVDADEGQELNRSYRGKDYATNVLTFAYAQDEGYRARIRNHGHSCFLCEIVIRSQFHTTYEPEA